MKTWLPCILFLALLGLVALLVRPAHGAEPPMSPRAKAALALTFGQGWQDRHDVSPVDPFAHLNHTPAVKKSARPDGYGACSDACTCGCNDGGPCRCGATQAVPAAPPATYYAPAPVYAPAFQFFGGFGNCGPSG